MLIDNRLRMREMRPDDEDLPCTGNTGAMATLEVFRRPLLRGNRSRIVLIAGELDVRLGSASGRLEAFVIRYGVPAEEAARTWVPSARGRLLYITCFGAELLSVHRRDDERSGRFEPDCFSSGEEILLGLRSRIAGTAEIVLFVEFPS